MANPGCYPTSVQLPLCPLLSAGLVETEDIIIDAKSAVSGAGGGAEHSGCHCMVNLGCMKRGGKRRILRRFSKAVVMREDDKDVHSNKGEFKFRNLFANSAKTETFFRL